MKNSEELFGLCVYRDKYLYHYTKLATALEKILNSGTLMFNLFSCSNDPRETKEWISTGCSTGSIDKKVFWETVDIGQKVTNQIKKQSKILCFSLDSDETTSKNKHSRGYFKSRMWAQYAENHRGICLVFNREKITEKINSEFNLNGFLKSEKVTYHDKPPVAHDALTFDCNELGGMKEDQLLNIYLEKYASFYFFTKNYDWKDESEYRFVLLNNNPEPEFFYFQDALEAIICGEDLPSVYIPLLTLFKEKYNCQLAQIETYNGVPTLNSI